MAKKADVHECPHCGRLHEIDRAADLKQIQCDCGKKFDLPTGEAGKDGTAAGAKAETEGAAEAQPAGQKPSAFARLVKSWKLVGAIAAAILIGAGLLTFWKGPKLTLGLLNGGGTGPAKAVSAPKEDPEPYLHVLEDNMRVGEQQDAATALLRINDPIIVPRLSEMARRTDLESRMRVIHMLGEKGEESALQVLEDLIGDSNHVVSFASTEAVTRIGTPMAESVLRQHMLLPAAARDMLPSIAAVRNDCSARIVGSCLDDPSLRPLALSAIGKVRHRKCIPDVVRVAADRLVSEADRLKAIEVLGLFDVAEARRALLNLSEDSIIGWKAREVLERK